MKRQVIGNQSCVYRYGIGGKGPRLFLWLLVLPFCQDRSIFGPWDEIHVSETNLSSDVL